MVRSVDPTRPDVELSSGRFAAQLALARVHPALAPMVEAGAGYTLDLAVASSWFALPAQRGLAGYGLARALRILLDVLAGLTALHETQTADGAAFVHGEVIPALVRVDRQGIARLQPLAAWHWQTTEAPLSPQSLGHLAPERILGDAIDRRADVYSAGVGLWEALAGKRLFERDTSDEIITRLMGGKVLLPELPPELAWAIPLKAVAMRALSVDPEQRFADCPELAAAIEAVARRQIASHALVAAHFAEPARVLRSAPPSLPHADPSAQAAYRASHKSSLSALVSPTFNPLPSAEVEVALAPAKGGARRVAWTLAALAALGAAFGVADFARHAQTYTAAHEAAPSMPAAPVAASVLALGTSVAPSASAAPSEAPELAAPKTFDADAPLPTPERPTHSSHAQPSAREAKGHGAASAGKLSAPSVAKPAPAAVAKPAAPVKAPRVRATEAEQYGI